MRATTSSILRRDLTAAIAGGSHVGAAASTARVRAVGRGVARRRSQPRSRARFVEHVDGAVGQLVVAQVPRRQLRRRLERVVGVLHAVVRLVARAQALRGSARSPGSIGSSIAIFCSRRASARSFSMCLNSSCVVEPTTRSWPVVRIGLISVARSIVPPVVAPAPTVEWISSMKRIGIGRFASALMTALKRSSKSPRNRVPASSAPVSSEKTSAPSSRSGTSSCEQPRARALRRARSCRRRRRRRTPGCSCGGGRGSPSSAAARRRGRSADRARRRARAR